MKPSFEQVRDLSLDLTRALTSDALQSPAALRSAMHPLLKDRSAEWIRLGGIDLQDPRDHRALLTSLVRLGFGTGEGLPEAVVLDWSTSAGCGADGLAFFAVISRHLAALGTIVLACEPESSTIRAALDDSVIRSRSGCIGWARVPSAGQTNCRSVAPAALFGPGRDVSIDLFLDNLSAFGKSVGLPTRAARAVSGAAIELIHNTLSHGGATEAAACALFHPRRRPPVLQVGIADDGIGIPSSLLAQPRHQWLCDFSDAIVTRAALRGTMSGRADDQAGACSGGGMSRLVRRLTTELKATVTIRSGAAFLVISGDEGQDVQLNRLTLGCGTQTNVEIPIRQDC